MTAKLFSIAVMVLLLSSTLSAQSKIDSLLKVLNTLENDSLKAKTYTLIGKEYGRIDQKRAIEYYSKAEELSHKIGLQSNWAEAKSRKGVAYIDMKLFEKAEEEFNTAIVVFRRLKNTSKVAGVLTSMGTLRSKQHRVEDAVRLYLEALTLSKESGNKNQEALVYNFLGTIYRVQDQYSKAIENYTFALSIVKELNFKPGISACLLNLGTCYLGIEKYDQAITYLNDALVIKNEMGDKLGACRALGSLAQVYMAKQEYDLSEDYYTQSYDLAKEVGNLLDISLGAFGIAEIALYKNDFEKCIALATDIVADLPTINEPELSVDTYGLLSSAHEKKGDFQKALDYARLHNTASESFYDSNILSVTNEIEAKYQNDQKTKEIALLASENELQVLQTQKRKSERNYLIAFSAIALLLITLVYNQYRIKQKANTKLEELDGLKSDFFANISHEFRTPLSLIMAPLKEKIEHATNGREKKEYNMMYRNADRLFNLINQLLDLSKLEAGSIKLERSVAEAGNFFRIIVASFSSLAEYRNINFQSDAPDTDLWLEFDQDIIQKVCYNLLSNAFKFTQDGGEVKFEVKVNNGLLSIAVSDTGSGIPIEDQKKVFDRFFQSSNGQNLGTGIGLALTKQLVEFHHGSIELESMVGQGSTFRVAIPVIIAEAQADALVDAQVSGQDLLLEEEIGEADQAAKGPTVLIIEDNTDLRNYLGDLLEDRHLIFKSPDGISGISKAKEVIPDLIISDVMMPGKGGMEVCQELKAATETDHIPIILLTARADQESKLQGLTHGADDYLLKPFDPKELKLRVSNLLEQRSKLKTKYAKLLLLEPTEIEISSSQESFLKTVMQVVERHIDDPEFNIDQFCSDLGISRMQLHRKLTALTDYSPGAFIRRQRLSRATQLLAAGEPVSQVAYAVGFTSLSYFSKVFKEVYGVVPSSYAAV